MSRQTHSLKILSPSFIHILLNIHEHLVQKADPYLGQNHIQRLNPILPLGLGLVNVSDHVQDRGRGESHDQELAHILGLTQRLGQGHHHIQNVMMVR
jgi:hypothetical protein